jgi:hypothetical protein
VSFSETFRYAGNTLEYDEDWLWLVIALLALGAVVDVILAGSLVFYLWRQRNSTTHRRYVS